MRRNNRPARRVLVIVLVLMGLIFVAQRPSILAQNNPSTLRAGNLEYVIVRDRITARQVKSGRIVWQRSAPARSFRWLGVSDKMLVGAGKEMSGDPNDHLEQLFGLERQSGRSRWQSNQAQSLLPEAGVVGRVVVFSYTNAVYALNHNDLLDVDTGQTLTSPVGSLVHRSRSSLVFACSSAPTPYCNQEHGLKLTRIDPQTLKFSHHTFLVPSLKPCGARDTNSYPHPLQSRYNAESAEYVYENGCQYVYLRYRWDSASPEPVFRQDLDSLAWPK